MTRRHHRLSVKIGKIAKFSSYLWKTNEDIAPQWGEIYRRLYDGSGGGGVGEVAPTIQKSVKFHNFEELYLRSLKTYHFQIWQFLLVSKSSFQWCRRIFPNLSMSKVEKVREKVCCEENFFSPLNTK